VVEEDAAASGVAEHARGAVGRHVAEPLVVVLAGPVAQVAEAVEEVAGEEARADAQLQDEDVPFEGSGLVGREEAGEEDLGGADGLVAVVVDHPGDRLGVAHEGQAAAVAQILLAQLPLQAFGEGAIVLQDDAAGLCVVEDVQG
jgi:hypothetical protein